MTKTIPFSAACERNKDVILEAVEPVLRSVVSVLEVGSGTGQHAVHFAEAMPHLIWQTSDQTEYLDGVRMQLEMAGRNNALMPLELDVNQIPWLQSGERYEAVFTANTFHIMRWREVRAFFQGLQDVTTDKSFLIIYGPFKYAGKFTSLSNHEFDLSLQSRGVGSGIRDFEAVLELATDAGFELISDTVMPANNQCLIFKKEASTDSSL